MSLADSKNAIGAVTRLVKKHLVNRTGEQVTVGKPEDAAGNTSSAQTNLFLYEIEFDGSMKNLALNPGDRSAIWLVLKYALTCFDSTGKSDTPESHDLLGKEGDDATLAFYANGENAWFWQTMIPEGIDTVELDFPFLSGFPLAGGHIRLIVFAACLKAAHLEMKRKLTMPIVIHAIKREYDKLDRAIPTGQLGPYQEIFSSLLNQDQN